MTPAPDQRTGFETFCRRVVCQRRTRPRRHRPLLAGAQPGGQLPPAAAGSASSQPGPARRRRRLLYLGRARLSPRRWSPAQRGAITSGAVCPASGGNHTRERRQSGHDAHHDSTSVLLVTSHTSIPTCASSDWHRIRRLRVMHLLEPALQSCAIPMSLGLPQADARQLASV